MTKTEQIKSLAAAIDTALEKARDGENHDDCCITAEPDGSFEYWNSESAYSDSIDPERVVIRRAWDLGGDYGPGDGEAYAQSFIDELLADLEG